MARGWLKSASSSFAGRAAWEAIRAGWAALPESVRGMIIGPIAGLIVGSGLSAFLREYWYALPPAGLLIGFGVAGALVAFRDWRLDRAIPCRTHLLRAHAEGKKLLSFLEENEMYERYGSEFISRWRESIFAGPVAESPQTAIRIRHYVLEKRLAREADVDRERIPKIRSKLIVDVRLHLEAIGEILGISRPTPPAPRPSTPAPPAPPPAPESP